MALRAPRKVALVVAGVVVVLLIVFNPPASVKPVRIGYLPIYVDLPLFVAKDKGFFDQRGVKTELVRFAASPEIGTALTTGDVQVGASVAYSVALSNESRDPNKLKVFIVDSETPENYLDSFVVLAKSGIRSVGDIRGKKLGVFPGPTAVTFCKMVLAKYGLDPKADLQITEIDVSSHLNALEAGTVDALFTYEPTATQAVLEKNAVKILPGAVEREIINPWQAGVWVISTGFYRDHPVQAHAVMLALYDAIDYLRNNTAEAKAHLSGYTSIKVSVALATPTIPFAKVNEVNLGAFQRHADILRTQKIVSKSIDAASLLIPREWVGEK